MTTERGDRLDQAFRAAGRTRRIGVSLGVVAVVFASALSFPGAAVASETPSASGLVSSPVVISGFNPLSSTPTPTLSGAVKVGSTLTIVPGIWQPAPVTLSYRWFRNTLPIDGVTSSTYKIQANDIGAALAVQVTGSKTGYTSATVNSADTVLVPPQVFTAAPIPTITGTAAVGSVLTANTGTWLPSGITLAYQWKSGGVAVAGATARTFTPTVSQAGTAITVSVTGTKTGFARAVRTSSATATVPVLSLTSTPVPTIAGVARVGSALTATAGTWAPASVNLTYQWYVDSSPVAGATARTFVPASTTVGKKVTVRVTGTKTGYASVTQGSTATLAIVNGSLTPAAIPTITGSARVGSALTAVPGTWGPAPVTLHYQWFIAGAAASGATGSTFTLPSTAVGKTVTVRITGTRAGYTSTSKTSASTTAVLPGILSASPVPSVTGTARVGSALTAVPGTWGPAPVTLSYKWFVGGLVVDGATSPLYTPTGSDVGKAVVAKVTGARVGYSSVTRASAPTGLVTAATITVTSSPSISGQATVGSTLTTQTGTWSPSDVTFSYQWSADGAAIGGASAPTFIVSSAEIGKAMSVTVTGSKAGYASLSSTTAALSPVPTPAVTGRVAATTQRMSSATLNSTQAGEYQAGSVLTLVCSRIGQSVKGYFSPYIGNSGWDSLWYQVNDGYYVADVDLETGTLDPIVPACAGAAPADSTNATVMATTQRMSGPTLNSSQNGTYGQGSRLTLACYTHGQAVKGYFSGSFPGGYDDVWYQVNDQQFVADVDIETGSNDPVTPQCSTPVPAPSDNSVLTRAKSWLDAGVPYNQGSWFQNQFGSYRQDCSGFVSMAFGLPTSYVTGTLPQVFTRINKDDLQPGDIMLNTAAGNNGHTGIFVRWADAGHTKYVSWEENGGAGKAFEQTVPYPYWPSWSGTPNYNPYRKS